MNIESVIKEQEDFIRQVLLTLMFLKMYAGNPESFELLLSKAVKEEYEYEKYKSNPEYLWETLDTITCDIVHGPKKFAIKQNGIFPCLDFAAKKKKAASATNIINEFESLACDGWEI